MLDLLSQSLEFWAAFIASAGVVGFFLQRYIILPIYRWVLWLNKALQELLPNGGGSLGDIIRRLESKWELVSARTLCLQDTVDLCIYECDADGKCTHVNWALAHLWGMDPDSFMENGWLAGVEPSDRIRVYDHWISSVQKGIPYETEYVVINQRNQRRYRVATRAQPMFNGQHQIMGYHGIMSIKETLPA